MMTTSSQHERAAVHAAVHAIAAVIRHIPFAGVSLASGVDLTPAIQVLTDPTLTTATRRRRARRVIEVCLAGAEAERCVLPKATPHTCPTCVIGGGAWTLAGLPDPDAFRQSRSARMQRHLERHAPRVRALAARLLETATLTAADVHELTHSTAHPQR